MNEKKEIEAMVRAALAGGAPMRAERLAVLERAAARAWAARRRRRLGGWRRPLLVAASLTVVCGLGAWRFVVDRRLAEECRAEAMLELLEEFDGRGIHAECETYADRLVAWQDAPYEEIVR